MLTRDGGAAAVVDADRIEGWELIEHACELLDRLASDLFRMPELAEARAVAALERDGDNHGDDLVCGCWGAAEEATALLQLAGRHVTALITLASIDPRHLTPAHTLGRAVIEQGLRIQWLLEPDAVADRELRWLAFKAEEARLYRGSAGFDDLVTREEERVRDAEERTGQKIPGVPRVVDLADQFSPQRSLYELYRLLSQTTHGTTFGAGTFHVDARVAWRRQGGTGEWLEAEFWAVPLVACRDALIGALIAYRDRFAPDGPLPSLEDNGSSEQQSAEYPPTLRRKRPPGFVALLSRVRHRR